ncbi:hypothetical protein HZC09_03815 [Candidatus Micrarchaeota archaeon]|nr:hypothetical protein [Candidatus Micrarchaeota archaeon]
MKKQEIAYAAILADALKGNRKFTQKGLSEKLGFSISMVNAAVKSLERIGAVQVNRRSFVLQDAKKALLYWASRRNLEKDIAYKTRVDAPPRTIERSMPAGTVFTGYSAYRLLFGEAPADYGEVYAYAADLAEVRKRFPPRKGPPNLFVMAANGFPAEKSCVTTPHLYVDLWNMREWYAKEFLEALEGRLRGILE